MNAISHIKPYGSNQLPQRNDITAATRSTSVDLSDLPSSSLSDGSPETDILDANPLVLGRLADIEVRILLVDDNPDDVSIMRRLLAQYPQMHFKVRSAGSLVNGLDILATEGADVLILDYSLPSEDGDRKSVV